MKRGVSVAVIIAICSLSSFGQSAVAEQRTPPPLPSGILEQFKKDMDAFNFAMALRDQQISEINQSFYLAINKANQANANAEGFVKTKREARAKRETVPLITLVHLLS